MLHFTALPPLCPSTLLLLYPPSTSFFQHSVPPHFCSTSASFLRPLVLLLLCFTVNPFICCSVSFYIGVSDHCLLQLAVHYFSCCYSSSSFCSSTFHYCISAFIHLPSHRLSVSQCLRLPNLLYLCPIIPPFHCLHFSTFHYTMNFIPYKTEEKLVNCTNKLLESCIVAKSHYHIFVDP